MAGEEVFQDSDAIRAVADSIQGDKTQFDKLTDEFYKLIHDGITAEDTGDCAWFGPSAAGFAGEVDGQKKNFDTASQNMGTLISSLNEHAETWDNFENSHK